MTAINQLLDIVAEIGAPEIARWTVLCCKCAIALDRFEAGQPSPVPLEMIVEYGEEIVTSCGSERQSQDAIALVRRAEAGLNRTVRTVRDLEKLRPAMDPIPTRSAREALVKFYRGEELSEEDAELVAAHREEQFNVAMAQFHRR
jgi:hypothetical protein